MGLTAKKISVFITRDDGTAMTFENLDEVIHKLSQYWIQDHQIVAVMSDGEDVHCG